MAADEMAGHAATAIRVRPADARMTAAVEGSDV